MLKILPCPYCGKYLEYGENISNILNDNSNGFKTWNDTHYVKHCGCFEIFCGLIDSYIEEWNYTVRAINQSNEIKIQKCSIHNYTIFDEDGYKCCSKCGKSLKYLEAIDEQIYELIRLDEEIEIGIIINDQMRMNFVDWIGHHNKYENKLVVYFAKKNTAVQKVITI